jgi:undecaprenyl-diphosphatase
LIETLQHIDRELFLFLNGMHNGIFDFLMYWVSDRFIWIPLYAWFLYMIIKKYRKRSWLIILLIALLATVSDQLTVFLKNYFERPRPCHDEQIASLVHTVKNVCGGPYGFVSGHASNSFALAAFLIPFLRTQIRFFVPAILFWAALIAYSRIYLGVHYPGDILAGALLGAFLGYLFSRIYPVATRLNKNLKENSD